MQGGGRVASLADGQELGCSMTISANRVALSVEEVAKAVGASPSFIWKNLKEGSLSSVRVGRRRMIRAADLDAWLAKNVVVEARHAQ